MQAPSLTDAQANTILGALIANLTIVRASPERTSPGIPTTASLVPLTPVIDVFDLAEGVINVAGTVKEVIFANANALTVPDSGALASGASLASNQAAIAGGQPFPPPTRLSPIPRQSCLKQPESIPISFGDQLRQPLPL